LTELDKSGYVIYQLGMEAVKMHWPHIVSQLGGDIYFRQSGSLMVSHPADRADLLNTLARIDSNIVSNNIKLASRPYSKLDQSGLMQLEPELSKFDAAYFMRDEAQIDNQSLMRTLKKYLCEQNVKWYANSFVNDMTPGNIQVNNQNHAFDMVFDCRGLGAKSVFDSLQAVRGEIIWLHAPDVNISRPLRFTHPRYHLYVVPRPANVYLLGASEIYAEDYSDISVRTTLELLTAAYYLHPGFAEARIINTVTHCRPVLSDHMPKIKRRHTLVAINGLYRHGFMVAPAIAAEISRWLDNGETSLHYPPLWEDA
jgi:glycine oxidase